MAHPAVFAGECPGEREGALLADLNRQGEYGLAALQGELFLRGAPTCALHSSILLETGKAHYHLGEFARVRALFRARALDADPAFRRHYLESHLLEERRVDLRDSVRDWLGGEAVTRTLSERERRLYAAAVFHLQGLGEEARRAWPDAPAAGPGEEGRPEADPTDPAHYLALGWINPRASAAWSILPGGGYFHAGRPADGWTALTAVALLYGAAAWYAYHDAPARGLAAAGLGAVFHVSGIYGGYRAGLEANRKRRRAFLFALHGRLP